MKQRGEIVTVLTVISLGIMLAGIVLGNLAVKKQTSTQSKAIIRDPDNPEFNQPSPPEVLKDKEDDYFPDTEEIKKPPKVDQPVLNKPEVCKDGSFSDKHPDGICPDFSKSIPPTDTPVPPSPAPTGTVPLPGHSKIDCGGVGNQCNPATDNPQTCGNDGCLHAAVGRPTQAPTQAPSSGIIPTLPGRNPGACGGSWYQCSSGEFGCGNDGCSNIKLGRPFDQPVPIPTEFINAKPLPGRKPSDCKGAYYQCANPGVPPCGRDGCSDERLRRGKYAVAPILTPGPGTPVITPSIAITAPSVNFPCNSTDQDRFVGETCYTCQARGDGSLRWITSFSCSKPSVGNLCDDKDGKKIIVQNKCLECDNKNNQVIIRDMDQCPKSSTFEQRPACEIQWGGTCELSENCKDYCTYSGSNSPGRMGCAAGKVCCNISYTICRKNDPSGRCLSSSESRCSHFESGCDIKNGERANINLSCDNGFELCCVKSSSAKLEVPGLPLAALASANDWAKVASLAREGKVNALSVSAWVHEAAKYYYPGIQIRFCDPTKGECDFKL